MKIKRRKCKAIKIGGITIGGNHLVAIQSMTKIRTSSIEATLRQIEELTAAGCEIIRLSVTDFWDAKAIKKIKPFSRVPLVADIHFDFRLALAAIDNGIDKIRLNPGNIYKLNQIREIARAAKAAHIPIRVGVNSGSLRSRKSQAASRKSQADEMVKSALDYIKILERFGFNDIVVSLKAANIFATMDAYRRIAQLCDYPLHLGTTATGESAYGMVKSAMALGTLLLEGIGDTLRVSLTDRPLTEVQVAKSILETLGLRKFGPQIISCPTCGRCSVDLVKMVKDLAEGISTLDHRGVSRPIKVAVMGCTVNGPGEAKEADLGIAFGRKEGLLFKKGRALRKISAATAVEELLKEMKKK
jgi:(E)-4-hydroxy-3-methylbut-2-enyl-diphosphate synthase